MSAPRERFCLSATAQRSEAGEDGARDLMMIAAEYSIVQAEGTAMKEPTTPEEVKVLHDLLRSDPRRHLQIVNEWIAENPRNSHAYFDRHFAWMKLGEPRRALDDLNMVIQLDPQPVSFWTRGEVYRDIGEYEKALEDFDRAEAMDPEGWEKDIVFGLLYQADCHARLGNEAAALACRARLPMTFGRPASTAPRAGVKPKSPTSYGA
jgi:tetratricopeptide (TPR) repeat protein